MPEEYNLYGAISLASEFRMDHIQISPQVPIMLAGVRKSSLQERYQEYLKQPVIKGKNDIAHKLWAQGTARDSMLEEVHLMLRQLIDWSIRDNQDRLKEYFSAPKKAE